MSHEVFEALQDGYTEPVRDALWGHVYLTPGLAALVQSAPFMRLSRIFQLGPAYMVYPGATHTRAAHSIGVYYLARRMLINLAERGAAPWLRAEGVRSFLCAALLHDLGHFPYTHSLKELPLKSHEKLTGELIMEEPLQSLVKAAGAEPRFTAAIVDGSLQDASSDGGELAFYRKLLSGALDPDKLDYLNRDARCCGVPYGAQDVDFILSRLYPSLEKGVMIDSRGIPSVESILFSKYLMYRTVYWHPQVRAATAMIKKALFTALSEGAIAPEELYGLDDQGLFALLEKRCPHSSLAKMVKNGQLFLCAVQFPYDEAKTPELARIDRRSAWEIRIAEGLSRQFGFEIGPDELIIDLPERVSFETGLYVADEAGAGCDFSESSSVFTAATIAGFAKSLRVLRIFIDPKAKMHLQDREKQVKVKIRSILYGIT